MERDQKRTETCLKIQSDILYSNSTCIYRDLKIVSNEELNFRYEFNIKGV